MMHQSTLTNLGKSLSIIVAQYLPSINNTMQYNTIQYKANTYSTRTSYLCSFNYRTKLNSLKISAV